MCPMSMSMSTNTNAGARTFHRRTTMARSPARLPPRASEGRVVTMHSGLDAELAMDERLRRLPRAEEDFVLVHPGEVLPGHEGRLVLLKTEGRAGHRFADALDPRREPARVVLSRLAESFSRLCSILIRLQDEGVVHGALCMGAVVFDGGPRVVRLGRFAHAIPVLSPGTGPGPVARSELYARALTSCAHVAPELRLAATLVSGTKERVDAADVVAAGLDSEQLGELVGQERGIAVSQLEGGWRAWDVYSLTRMYTELIEDISPALDTSRNTWLRGVLAELRKGWRVPVAARPGLVQLRGAFERAWYESGDVESCQAVVQALEATRLRAGNDENHDLPLVP